MNDDINGIGKEYDEYMDKLEFEGEYLNGRRNGKGKEYYRNGKLKYEGEYLNDKRSGKGKEYNYDGKLEFEGEYLNNKKWIGIRYDKDGNISYKLNNNSKEKNIGKIVL